jgi:hypothetical protein
MAHPGIVHNHSERVEMQADLMGRRRIFVATVAGMIATCLCASSAIAEEGDQFEGAIWQFELTQKKSPDTKLVGQYRIAKHVVYQKTKRDDKDFSKEVGKNHPEGKKTKMEVTEFRAFNESEKKRLLIEGTARLKLVKGGEWSGVFTDKDGINWDMKCTRIQE